MKRQQFVVVVPVKPPAVGKSRLRVPEHVRPGLASAFALDVLSTAQQVASVSEVVVMTPDAAFAGTCAALGIRTLPDGDGLNDGLARAAEELRGTRPDALPVALCADLPCLTPADLAAALAAVTDEIPWYCADAEGTGTTLYTATYADFAPRFGTGSSGAHRLAGARPVPGALPTLRRDVDDEADLAEAMRIGPGANTREVLAALAP